MELLKLDKVSRQFGDLTVIENLSFSVYKHSVFGFIGKNGAGKTTTMKMILGFLKPSSGNIYVCGERVIYGDTKTNRHIGYLPDVPEYYGFMKPREYLKLCGEITGLKGHKLRTKSDELLELVGLDNANRKIHGFSRGMKQRLGIAQALLTDPELIICDEPTSALDPIGRKEILDILSLAKEKTTIIFSTHILSDVERICDSIGVLDKGSLVLQGELSKLKTTYRQNSILIELAHKDDMSKLKEKLSNFSLVSKTTIASSNSLVVFFSNLQEANLKIMELLYNEKIQITKYEVLEPSLENMFLEVVK